MVPRGDASGSKTSPRTIRVAALVGALAFVAAVALFVDRHVPAQAWSAQLSAAIVALQANTATIPAALAMLLLFVAATCVGCPINLGIAACVLALAPWRGAVVAFAGTLASAAILHALGGRVSARQAARWFGKRTRLRRELRRSVVAVALARLLPVAPYAVVSLFAGALRVPRKRYLLGTAIGMAPGILVYAVFIDRAEAVLRSAHAPAAFAAMACALLIAGIWLACERRVKRRRASP